MIYGGGREGERTENEAREVKSDDKEGGSTREGGESDQSVLMRHATFHPVHGEAKPVMIPQSLSAPPSNASARQVLSRSRCTRKRWTPRAPRKRPSESEEARRHRGMAQGKGALQPSVQSRDVSRALGFCLTRRVPIRIRCTPEVPLRAPPPSPCDFVRRQMLRF